MNKSINTEIQNEYNTQIKDLEGSLKTVGEFEAIISKNSNGRILSIFVNFVFSNVILFISIAALVLATFFSNDFLHFLNQHLELSFRFFVEKENPNMVYPKDFIQYFLYVFGILLLFISLLLRSLRVKNNYIFELNDIVSDVKNKVLNMLNLVKNRQKAHLEHMAREKQSYTNRDIS